MDEAIGVHPVLGVGLRAVPRRAAFGMAGWYVWCGTMARTADGVCHLLFSRWPAEAGFDAWVTHSQIAYATAEDPLGPYRFQGVALAGAGERAWDAHVTHNPTLLQAEGRYYLYYMGNHGDGDWWTHRNHQRIGVAVADHPGGPWRRSEVPLIDVSPDGWDRLITSNPSVTRTGDGRYLMMYKTVGPGPMPFGGKVVHAVAVAEHPEGPFVKHPQPVLTHPTAQFPAEDPFIWHDGRGFKAIVKDMGGHFTGAGTSLAVFESADGVDWRPAARPLLCARRIVWEDGEVDEVDRLERPQVWFEGGRPRVLLCAVRGRDPEELSCNVQIPLGE